MESGLHIPTFENPSDKAFLYSFFFRLKSLNPYNVAVVETLKPDLLELI